MGRTQIGSDQIGNDEIKAEDLNASNSPINNAVPVWKTATNEFKWTKILPNAGKIANGRSL
jgi:hypothetical protein